LVLDARDPVPLAEAAGEVSAHGTRVTALPGDVTDAGHRGELVAAARGGGGAVLLGPNPRGPGAHPRVGREGRRRGGRGGHGGRRWRGGGGWAGPISWCTTRVRWGHSRWSGWRSCRWGGCGGRWR